MHIKKNNKENTIILKKIWPPLKTLIIIVVFAIILISLLLLQLLIGYPRPIGTLTTTKNPILQSNINSFMESRIPSDVIGRENYHCSNILYGYDKKYAYTWIYCNGFVAGKELITPGGSSVPTRLAYQQPNFQIMSFKEPIDGKHYPGSLRRLFPKQIYDSAIRQPSRYEIMKLEEEVRSKIKLKTHGSKIDPYLQNTLNHIKDTDKVDIWLKIKMEDAAFQADKNRYEMNVRKALLPVVQKLEQKGYIPPIDFTALSIFMTAPKSFVLELATWDEVAWIDQRP